MPDVPTVPLVVVPVAVVPVAVVPVPVVVVPAVVLVVALPRSISSIEAVNRAIAALSTVADALVGCVVCVLVVPCVCGVVCGFWAVALLVEPVVPAVPVIVLVVPVVPVASGVSWLVVAGDEIDREAAEASSPPGARCAMAVVWNWSR